MWICLRIILLSIILLTVPYRTQADQPDHISERWAALFSDQESASPVPHTPPSLYQTNLSSTFSRPVVSSRLRDLSPETDQPRTQGLLAATTWLKGTFTTEAEVASNQGGTGWILGSVPGNRYDDISARMVRVGLTGTAGVIRYGMMYRSAGQAFLNGPDTAVREVWGEWKHGWTTLRSTIGQQWNNVAGDAARSRLEQTYGRVGVGWNKPAWPSLTLTYAKNSLSSTLNPINLAPQRTHNHTLEAALAYNSARWNATLASTYIIGNDLFRNGAESNIKMQLLTASFRPLNTLTIAPTLIYREEKQEWSGVRIDSPSASLALQYKQSQRLLITAAGNYAGVRSRDRLVDLENLGGKGVLAWDLQQSAHWMTLISLEAGYTRQTNHATPSADTEDISGVVRFVLASL
ncbi:MAG: hypothetical protein P0111_06600 [Nitrospira sp.]|nr:hypothetical protein [Nitrospira sp.]